MLEFERSIQELENKIEELRRIDKSGNIELQEEIKLLQEKVEKQIKAVYHNLTPWQRTLVARHPERPRFIHYIESMISDFVPLAGDRCFSDDKAIIGGIGRFHNRSVMVIGHEKGGNTEERVTHNFGMPLPEGYRKAVRLMGCAERFGLPIITLVNTAGAFPGIQAEERGQAQAIAASIDMCLSVKVPLVAVIVGEGGSGGAIALSTANKVLIMEHAIYSVISPEGCASILWRSSEKSAEAAEALKLTSNDLLDLKVVDEIIPEPCGGAHRSYDEAIKAVDKAILNSLIQLDGLSPEELKKSRREKFITMGQYLH